MTELERELVALGAVLDVPSGVGIEARVRASIAVPPRRSRRRLIAVIVAVVIGGVAAAPVVADWLGVGGVEVRQEPPQTTQPSPGTFLNLGTQTTLRQARADVGFTIVVPAELGPPDEVWIDRASAVEVVWLAYRPRVGLPEGRATGYGALLAQAEQSVDEELWATKFAEPNTKIERVELGTGRALWVQGTHYVGLRDGTGEIAIDRLRLSDNVLLWERGRVTLRLELALDRDAAVRIARSTP
jgi:hypothetical protein